MKRPRYYTYRSLHREREYGAYWYSGLWIVLRPVLVGLCVAVTVIGLIAAVWSGIYNRYAAAVDAGDDRPVAFEIPSGASLTRVSRNLEEAGLVHSATVFKYYCDFAGLGQKIQSGNYQLNRAMTMAEIADRLTMGDGIPMVRNITLIPGWTVREFADYLVERGILEDSAEFLELCRTGENFNDYTYIADIRQSGRAAGRKYVLEGYLAADTYEVYTTVTAPEIIRKLLGQTDNLFTSADAERAAALGMDMDRIFTLASLIEKEAKTGDFARVSAVFHNRLKKNMRLDSDVTIHYITGERRMALTDRDLAVDSPYNTYRVTGLPPGPICSPSREAIRAALYPDEIYLNEGFLYFCAKDPESGELYFSRTLEEHERAVAAYQESWKRWDEERGIE